jgi:cytochrome c5
MISRVVVPRHRISALILMLIAACVGWVMVVPTSYGSPAEADRKTLGEESTTDLMEGVMGSWLPPGIPAADLPDASDPGAAILQQYCVQCHELPSPGLHASSEWSDTVARMVQRMQRMSASERDILHVSIPPQQDLNQLIAYLEAHGFRMIDITRYPDLDTPIGNAYQAVCSQCHALPDPALYTIDEWRPIVSRMRKNMAVLGVPEPEEVELSKALSFLQNNAKR